MRSGCLTLLTDTSSSDTSVLDQLVMQLSQCGLNPSDAQAALLQFSLDLDCSIDHLSDAGAGAAWLFEQCHPYQQRWSAATWTMTRQSK